MNIEDVKALLKELQTDLTTELQTIKNEVTSVSTTIKKFEKKFSDLFKRCDSIKNTAENAAKTAEVALETAKRAEENIATLQEQFDKLVHESSQQSEKRAAEFEAELSTMKVRNSVLEHRLEDQTNRACRKTLIFRGVEDSATETWEDTKNLLADQIAEVCEITPETSFEMIERCHRSPAITNKKKPRNIYACFYDWNDSEFVKNKFRKSAMKKGSKGVFVEQKYGENTTWRRNQALLARKKLMAEKTIVGGYVDYPAKLMVKYGKGEKKYQLREDFSKMTITKEAM